MMDIETKAILRLKEAAQMSQQIYEKPLILAYSGGKDSDVTLDLAIKAGIPFEAVYSLTTVDMPETVYHIRDVFKTLELQGIPCRVEHPVYRDARVSMWTLIPQKKNATDTFDAILLLHHEGKDWQGTVYCGRCAEGREHKKTR